MQQEYEWWKKEPLTISAVQCSLGDSDDFVLDEYVAKNGFNTEQLLHLVAKGHMGYYNEAEHGAKLDAYLKKSRAHGIREIVYSNTHCVSNEIAAEHPDWCERDKNGNTMEAYTVYNLLCVNPEGGYHKYFLGEVRALCRHDIDGIFLDGPLMREGGCYCDACKKTFLRKFGHPIEQASRYELQQLRVDLVTEHIRQISETVKSINPRILLYLNNSALRADVTGSNTRKLYPYVDMLGAEGGFQPASIQKLWQVSAMAKHLEGVNGNRIGGKPQICFFSGNQSPIAAYLHTPAETLMTYAQSVANGSNVWYGVHFSASEFKDSESAQTATAMNRFVLAHPDCYLHTVSCARVAVMWSQSTANNYASSLNDSDFTPERSSGFRERGDHYQALMNVCDMLFRNHVQFRIIDEESIEGGELSSYDAVILPTVACLSDSTAERLREFVRAGGNLLGNFDVGTYEPDGKPAAAPKLADVFGLDASVKPQMQVLRAGIGSGYSFVVKDSPLTDRLMMKRLPSPVLNLAWKGVLPETEVLMENCLPMSGRYSPVPKERYPYLTRHPFGKGCAYYVAGTWAETLTQGSRNVDYPRLLRGFCDAAARKVVVSDAPGLYEVSLRRTDRQYILHIVNITGAMTRPLEEVVPLHDVKFTLNLSDLGLPEREKFTVRSLRGAKVENLSQNGAELSFTLDRIGGYEAITIS